MKRPDLITSPEQLRAWRASIDASQATVAEVLAVGLRTYASWELGGTAISTPVAWALIAAEPHIASLVRARRRSRSAKSRRLAKDRYQRRVKKQRAIHKDEQREDMARFRKRLAAQVRERQQHQQHVR
jgi:DNA-binding XRE family transcriptional regulator